jgi:hypothetical protein
MGLHGLLQGQLYLSFTFYPRLGVLASLNYLTNIPPLKCAVNFCVTLNAVTDAKF